MILNKIKDLMFYFMSMRQRTNAYLARQEIEFIKNSARLDHKRLEPFGFKVYSQGDEDGIIEEIFRRLEIKTGNFLEIGVDNGLECNTLYLIHKGWRGAWIEGNKRQIPFIYKKFASIIPKLLSVHNEWLTVENINSIIVAELAVEDEVDFLSIDVDGNDVHLLNALTLNPKVICIEYNSKFPGNISKRAVYNERHQWTKTDYMGASLKGIWEVAQMKGYRLVGTNITGANAFFVRNDLSKNLFPDDSSPENLYNPPRYYLIFDHYIHVGHPADFGPYEDLEG